jgi:NADH-quinone oxidoreductase subunit A
MPTLLAYALLFTAIGAVFIFSHLMIGKLVRPRRPDAEKLTVYECGEPTIGSAWVQFDLRFYVVALLFVIFDVEMAFFFPWAVVFGKTNELAKSSITAEQREQTALVLDPDLRARLVALDAQIAKRDDDIAAKKQELAKLNDQIDKLANNDPERPTLLDKRDTIKNAEILQLEQLPRRRAEIISKYQAGASRYTWVAFLDILVFFAVLLVGFAYLWRRGDLNWVRSTAAQHAPLVGEKEESGRAPLATVV